MDHQKGKQGRGSLMPKITHKTRPLSPYFPSPKSREERAGEDQTCRLIRRGAITYQGQLYQAAELVPFEGCVAMFLIPEALHPQELCVQVEFRTVRIQRADELRQSIARSALLGRNQARRVREMPLATQHRKPG